MTDPLDSIDKRLVYAMEKQHLKVEALASLLDVSPAAVSRWRKGCPMGMRRLGPLCEALQISSDWLLFGKGDMHTPVIETELSNPESELIISLRTVGLHRGIREPVTRLFSHLQKVLRVR